MPKKAAVLLMHNLYKALLTSSVAYVGHRLSTMACCSAHDPTHRAQSCSSAWILEGLRLLQYCRCGPVVVSFVEHKPGVSFGHFSQLVRFTLTLVVVGSASSGAWQRLWPGWADDCCHGGSCPHDRPAWTTGGPRMLDQCSAAF